MPHFYGLVIWATEQQLVAASKECIQTPHTPAKQEKAHYQESVNKGIRNFHMNNSFKTMKQCRTGISVLYNSVKHKTGFWNIFKDKVKSLTYN